MTSDEHRKIREKAFKCERDCACMTGNGQPHCTISETVSDQILFTESRHPAGCPYQHSFGSKFICTCPVRKEILKNQNI